MAELVPLCFSLAAQQPEWPDQQVLREVRAELASLMPLVRFEECNQLLLRLKEVALGNSFVLQGGDCAETFESVSAETVSSKVETLLQMGVILSYVAALPVVTIGRIAGQYAKPRSKPTETRGEITLPAYRGDAVNGIEFDPKTRSPDPRRLLRMYRASAATLNMVRSLVHGPPRPRGWQPRLVRQSPLRKRYEQLMREVDAANRFMRIRGMDPDALSSTELYASHEALLLDYEASLLRRDPSTGAVYAGSGHMVWVGERTRQPDGVHVELVSQISNPIGVKVGPNATADEVLMLIDKLDPGREPGRLSLIIRMGVGKVDERLPGLVERVMASGAQPVWICDPTHGNTFVAPNGYKTRRFDDIVAELRSFFAIHHQQGTHPGGIHVELTGEEVTECIGGDAALRVDDLPKRYETACDPRLNREQSLELALMVAEMCADRMTDADLASRDTVADRVLERKLAASGA